MVYHIKELHLIWNRFIGYLTVILVVFLTSFPVFAEHYQVGFLAVRGESQARSTWEPTLMALNEALPYHQFSGRYLTQTELDKALNNDELDFLVTNPAHFMLSRGRLLSWLASYLDPRYGQARASVAGTLLVRADSKIVEPEQLRGQLVGAVQDEAFGGYLLVAEQLRRQGVFMDDIKLHFSGYPIDALMYLLRDGAVSAAMVPSCLLEDMTAEGLINSAYFRALMQEEDSHCARSTPLYPGWSFASVGNPDEPILRVVTQALLSLEVEGAPQWGAPIRLDEVAQLLMAWQLGPEPEPVAHITLLQQFIKQHWPWLGGLLLVVVALLLHHSWVRALLHKRTKECATLHHQVNQKEQALAQARQRMLMGEMATGLAHELNQPLSAIQAYAQAGELLSDPQQQNAAFQHIVTETERGAAIIRRFRQWATQPLPSAEAFELAELGEELVARMLPRAQEVGVHLLTDLTPGSLLSVRPAVEQILNNLLGNALDAHERLREQTVLSQRRILLQVMPTDNGWQVMIEDNAGGVDPAIIATLQQDLPASHYHGMGIGLLVSHRLVLRLRGKLSLYNTEQGTQAIVFFPKE